MVRYMEKRFLRPVGDSLAYMRVDGVMREDGKFVMMELEGIEPHLWIETAKDPTYGEALYRSLLRSAKQAT